MPMYEYRCLECKKRSTILQLSLTNPKPVSSSQCQSTKLERLISRVVSQKSEEARLESLSDTDTLGGLDKNDPQSMARYMKKMGEEMGEDFGDGLTEAMETPESSGSEMDSSDGL